jgi:hypothetical protein
MVVWVREVVDLWRHNIMRKNKQIHRLIRHLMRPLPMVVWVREVVDL